MLIKGLILNDPREAPQPGSLRIADGRIAEVRWGDTPEKADVGGAGAIICPAFVDAHIHLPQIDAVGCDGMALLPWLERVVFPAESLWGVGLAPHATRTAVRRMLREGTAAFAGYLTSHAAAGGESARLLAGGVDGARMRFAVGRVAMDRNAPGALIDEDRARAGLAPSAGVALAADGLAPRGERGVNPRFAVACSEELLAECGWFVRDRAEAGERVLVQTHLAESVDECRVVGELFPEDRDYASVYGRFGLLTERTLLAHCVHLAGPEWDLIAQRRSVVVHCPTANTFLQSGLFDLDAARAHGVRLALGSDVAGGPDVAMPRVARAMIEVAKVRKMTVAARAHVPSPAEVWEMITRGNAEAIGWPESGRLEEGAWADVLALRVPETWMDERLIGRLLYNWSAGLIEARVIAGRVVA
jgi:guanine deaminase